MLTHIDLFQSPGCLPAAAITYRGQTRWHHRITPSSARRLSQFVRRCLSDGWEILPWGGDGVGWSAWGYYEAMTAHGQ